MITAHELPMKSSSIKQSASASKDRNQHSEYDSKTLRLFLDFLMEEIEKNPESLVPYTKEMSDELDELLEGVT